MWGDGGADVRNQMLSIEIKARRVFTSSHVSRSYPTVFALFHPQRSLQMQLSDLLRWRSSHGSHQVEAVVLFEDLRRKKKKMRAWSRLFVECGVRAGKAIEPHKTILTFSTSSLLPSTASYESIRAEMVVSFWWSWRCRICESTLLMKPSTAATLRRKHTEIHSY